MKYKKRADGRYQTQIECGYDEFGKRKRRTIYGKTIQELKAKEIIARQEVEQNKVQFDNQMSFLQVAMLWLNLYTSNLSETTKIRYEAVIKNQLNPLANLKIQKITTGTVQILLNNLADKGYSSTVRLTKIVLHQIFKRAVLENIISNNPVSNVTLPTYSESQRRALTPAELKAIAETDNFSEKEKVYLYIGLYAGLRQGEILALTKQDIDFVNCKLTVSKTMIYPNNTGEIQFHTKTKAGKRVIPIREPLLSCLKTYIDSRNQEYLFLTRQGKLYSKTAKKNLWEQILKKINQHMPVQEATNITSHYLRHNFATDLYYAGIDVKSAQYLMGHSDIVTTLKIYTELDKQKIDLSKLEEYWLNGSQMVVN